MDSAFPPPLDPHSKVKLPVPMNRSPERLPKRHRFDPTHEAVATAADDAREQVRARLLRMILENERARRNEKRANLS